jgi:hypothetical protein
MLCELTPHPGTNNRHPTFRQGGELQPTKE